MQVKKLVNEAEELDSIREELVEETSISVSIIHSRHKSTNWGHYLAIYRYATIIYVKLNT